MGMEEKKIVKEFRRGDSAKELALRYGISEEEIFAVVEKYKDWQGKGAEGKPCVAESLLDGTEEWFQSIRDAAIKIGSTYASVHKAVTHNGKHAGRRWRFAAEGESPQNMTGKAASAEKLYAEFQQTVKRLEEMFRQMKELTK